MALPTPAPISGLASPPGFRFSATEQDLYKKAKKRGMPGAVGEDTLLGAADAAQGATPAAVPAQQSGATTRLNKDVGSAEYEAAMAEAAQPAGTGSTLAGTMPKKKLSNSAYLNRLNKL